LIGPPSHEIFGALLAAIGFGGYAPSPHLPVLHRERGVAHDHEEAALNQDLKHPAGNALGYADFFGLTHAVGDFAVVDAVVALPDVDQHLDRVAWQRLVRRAVKQVMPQADVSVAGVQLSALPAHSPA